MGSFTPETPMSDAVVMARNFAKKAHGEQKYGQHPYVHHLDRVADTLRQYGWTGDAVTPLAIAAYLHDVLEDTNVTAEQLRAEFGEEATRLVEVVTKLPGYTRKESNPIVLPRIARAGIEAVALKLADRIANVNSCYETKNGALLFMYHREHPFFVRCLRYDEHGRPRFDGLHAEMWDELDGLFGLKKVS